MAKRKVNLLKQELMSNMSWPVAVGLGLVVLMVVGSGLVVLPAILSGKLGATHPPNDDSLTPSTDNPLPAPGDPKGALQSINIGQLSKQAQAMPMACLPELMVCFPTERKGTSPEHSLKQALASLRVLLKKESSDVYMKGNLREMASLLHQIGETEFALAKAIREKDTVAAKKQLEVLNGGNQTYISPGCMGQTLCVEDAAKLDGLRYNIVIADNTASLAGQLQTIANEIEASPDMNQIPKGKEVLSTLVANLESKLARYSTLADGTPPLVKVYTAEQINEFVLALASNPSGISSMATALKQEEEALREVDRLVQRLLKEGRYRGYSEGFLQLGVEALNLDVANAMISDAEYKKVLFTGKPDKKKTEALVDRVIQARLRTEKGVQRRLMKDFEAELKDSSSVSRALIRVALQTAQARQSGQQFVTILTQSAEPELKPLFNGLYDVLNDSPELTEGLELKSAGQTPAVDPANLLPRLISNQTLTTSLTDTLRRDAQEMASMSGLACDTGGGYLKDNQCIAPGG